MGISICIYQNYHHEFHVCIIQNTYRSRLARREALGVALILGVVLVKQGGIWRALKLLPNKRPPPVHKKMQKNQGGCGHPGGGRDR
jgi:hypothetical protein